MIESRAKMQNWATRPQLESFPSTTDTLTSNVKVDYENLCEQNSLMMSSGFLQQAWIGLPAGQDPVPTRRRNSRPSAKALATDNSPLTPASFPHL